MFNIFLCNVYLGNPIIKDIKLYKLEGIFLKNSLILSSPFILYFDS